jgi:hypothetical protein
MKKLVKWVFVVAAVLVLVALAGLLYVYATLNSTVQSGVETYGPKVTGTAVTLDEVDIDLFGERVALAGLTVGNPEGFDTEHAFRLGEIAVHLDIGTVTEEVIVIHEIAVTQAEVVYEGGMKGTNIGRIKQNADTYLGEAPAEEAPSETQVVIETFTMKDSSVALHLTGVSGKTVALPPLVLEGIGRKDAPVTAAEAMEQILPEVFRHIGETVAKEGVDAGSLGGEGGVLDKLKDGADKALEGVKGLF